MDLDQVKSRASIYGAISAELLSLCCLSQPTRNTTLTASKAAFGKLYTLMHITQEDDGKLKDEILRGN